MLTGHFAALLLSVVITWAAYGWVCIGWGWAVARLLKLSLNHIADLVWLFWIGLGAILALLQLWHLAFPINGCAYLLVLGGGLLLSLPALSAFFSQLARAPRWQICSFALPTLLLAFWLADRAAGPGNFYDAGLYHIPAMEWAQAYPVVPGLVNLHFRLGFTSSITLLMALVGHRPWAGNGHHIMNGFLLTALAAMVVRGTLGILFTGAFRRPDHWLAAFCGVAVTEWALDPQISSYSTDLAAMVFSLAAATCFLSCAVLPVEDPRRKLRYLACLTLAAMSVSAKLSTLAFAAPLAFGVLWMLWGQRETAAVHLRQSLLLLLLPAILLTGWMAREIILTGYPLFPSPFLPLPLDWRYPMADTLNNEHVIRDFARWASLADSTKDYVWLSTWLHIRIFPQWYVWKALIPASAGLFALLVALLLWPRVRRLPTEWHALIWLYFCLGLALAHWWIAAPDPRFATQLFFLLFACGASLMAVAILGNSIRFGGRTVIVSLGFLFACGPILYASALSYGSIFRVVPATWSMPGPAGGFQTLPREPVAERMLPLSVPLYVPQNKTDQVWTAPLPNAPYFDNRLRLRNPPRLQDGFRLDTGAQ